MTLDLKPRIYERRVITQRKVFDVLNLPEVQKQMVLGLGRGWSDKQIAEHLRAEHGRRVSTESVKTYMCVLYDRTGMNRFQLGVLGSRMLEVMAS